MGFLKAQKKRMRQWVHHFLLGWRKRISRWWSGVVRYPTREVGDHLSRCLLSDLEAGSKDAVLSPTWKRFCERLEQSVREKDVARFLEWPEVIKPMFVGWSEFGGAELRYLRGLEDWKSRWEKVLPEDGLGAPAPYWCYPRSSGNRIHHVYHLAQFEQQTGRRIESFGRVVEFGGGYGSLCHLIHRLGFRGNYIIHDLPPFTALQRFYLSGLGYVVDGQDALGIQLSSSWDVLDRLLEGDEQETLFVATWSLSEAPPEVRELMVERLRRVRGLSAFLLAYQEHFDGWDNLRFFEGLPALFTGLKWKGQLIEVLPGHRYMMAA